MRLICFWCGKSVSSEVDDAMIFRACAVCPECIPLVIRDDAPPSILDRGDDLTKPRAEGFPRVR